MVGVELCLRHNEAIALVMPYVPHDRFQDYFDLLDARELREYMRNLLIALRHVHRFGVIHRDVKPSNFLHERNTGKYLLVDFGLAQNLKQIDSTKPANEHEAVGIMGIKGNNNDCDTSTSTTKEQPATNDTGTATNTEQPSANNTNHTNNRTKRKATEFSETENMKHTAKRINIGGDGDAVVPTANNTASASGSVENQPNRPQSTSPYIPSSVKSPLKQVNEISSPKGRPLATDAPLTRNVKSAVLGYSMHAKYAENKRNVAIAGAAIDSAGTGNDTKPTNVASLTVAVVPSSNTMATPPAPPTTATPPIKYVLDNRRSGANSTPKCPCYGQPTVCNICIVKKDLNAPRAGTPGYRPSEVLLKYPHQTTAVDVWAAGVILISILSGCYPFFKGTDDYQALAEIITVFGDEVVRQCARTLGRQICLSRNKQPLHLRKLCIRLRSRGRGRRDKDPYPEYDEIDPDEKCGNCEQPNFDCLCLHTEQNADFAGDEFPDSAYDLLAKLLAIHPSDRITAEDALEHPFFKEQL